MVTTEVIIRTHTHLAFYAETGSFQLPTANSAKRSEMLLAAHAAAGAVSLSKTAVAAAAGETAVAVRHLNVPVLMRIGMLALTVRSDAATRAAWPLVVVAAPRRRSRNMDPSGSHCHRRVTRGALDKRASTVTAAAPTAFLGASKQMVKSETWRYRG